MIQQGKLVAQGIPKETFRSANSMLQLADDEFENVLAVQFAESHRESGTTDVSLASGTKIIIPYIQPPPNPKLQIRVSADDILVATEKPNGISAANIFAGLVRTLEALDGDVMLTVFAGDEFFVRLTTAAVNRLTLKEETPVFLIMKTRSFRVRKRISFDEFLTATPSGSDWANRQSPVRQRGAFGFGGMNEIFRFCLCHVLGR